MKNVRFLGLDVHAETIAVAVPSGAGCTSDSQARVKTDRRDAEKLARCYRAGDLTPVWVPDAGHEALPEKLRAVIDALQAPRHTLKRAA